MRRILIVLFLSTFHLFGFSQIDSVFVDSVKIVLGNNPHDSEYIKSNIRLASHFYLNYDQDEAVVYIRHAVRKSLEYDVARITAPVHQLASNIYRRLEIMDTALVMSKDAEKWYRQVHDTVHIVRILCARADMYRNLSEYTETKNTLRAVKVLLADKDTISRVWYSYHWSVGMSESGDGNHLKSISHYYSASAIMEKMGDSTHLDAIYHNIGNNYIDIGDYDNALKLFLKSVRWNKYSKNDIWQINHYNAISEVYLKRQNYDSASFYNLAAEELSKKVNYHRLFTKKNIYSSLKN